MRKVTVVIQVVDIRIQSVLTSDGVDMCFGSAIKYRVREADKAILRVQDYDLSLQALCLGVCSRYINNHAHNECGSIETIEGYILKGIKEEARGWGIDIMAIYITDLGKTRNIRLLTDKSKPVYELKLGE